MDYEPIIIRILMEAGDTGLSISKIIRHTHNSVNTFFEQMSYEQVATAVRKFIKNNSQGSYALLLHTDKRGCYKLNKNSEKLIQQKLQFDK